MGRRPTFRGCAARRVQRSGACALYSREVVSALIGTASDADGCENSELLEGRGTFDRGDLKEAAGGAGRAMESLGACSGGLTPEVGKVDAGQFWSERRPDQVVPQMCWHLLVSGQ